MSAIGMLGTPAEIYRYGSQFGAILFSFPLVMYSVTYWYLPVFWKIEVSTSYEVGNLAIYFYEINLFNRNVHPYHSNFSVHCFFSI